MTRFERQMIRLAYWGAAVVFGAASVMGLVIAMGGHG